MTKMCLFYESPSGHARSDPIINDSCTSSHVHTFYGPKVFHPSTTYEDLINTPNSQSTSPVNENKYRYSCPVVLVVQESVMALQSEMVESEESSMSSLLRL